MFVWINRCSGCVKCLVCFVGLNDASVAGETRARTGNLAQVSLAEARLNHFRGRSPRQPAHCF